MVLTGVAARRPDRVTRAAALRWAAWLAGGLALAAAMVLASAIAFGLVAGPPSRELTLTIPRGTAALVAAGGAAPGLPTQVGYWGGDALVVRNDDVVAHRLGAWTVEPGKALRVPVQGAGASSFVCSFHPGGRLTLADGDPIVGWMILATVLLGVPFGLTFGAIATVMPRLDGPGSVGTGGRAGDA